MRTGNRTRTSGDVVLLEIARDRSELASRSNFTLQGLTCGDVECVQRLGGMLRFYRRAAATTTTARREFSHASGSEFGEDVSSDQRVLLLSWPSLLRTCRNFSYRSSCKAFSARSTKC